MLSRSGWVMGQPIFASGQKNQVRVGSGQKILTRIVMSNDFRQKRNVREQVHGFQPLTRPPSVGNLL